MRAAAAILKSMKSQTITNKITRWLLRFLQVQLFLTAISLPILISWGLPISIVSPLGNLIFSPALVAFLLLSSLIFLLQVICIPNGFLIYLLEKLTSWWLAAMSLGSSTRWLVGFGTPPAVFLVTVPLLAFAIIQNRKTNSLKRSILFLTLLLTCAFGYLKLINRPMTFIKPIECNGGTVTLIQTNGTTTLIDPGAIGRRISAPSWIEYTLAPTIIKTTGSNRIDHMVVLQPGIVTFNALEKLCATVKVGTIYLIVWEGSLSKNGWRSFFFMKRAAEKSGTKIVRIGKGKHKIELSANNNFSIEPLEKKLSYQNATYPALMVSGQIDNEPFTIYSAKYETMVQKRTNVENYGVKGKTMANTVMLVVASDGYQPIEYSVPKKILEHSGITVITASDKPGTATASDGTTTEVDMQLSHASIDDFDALFFIGGPGSTDHLDNETSYNLLQKTAEAKKPFGAICASVRILAKSGVLSGKKVTGWNGDSGLAEILEKANATYLRKDVVVDKSIITAIGPQAAQEFGAKILTVLGNS